MVAVSPAATVTGVAGEKVKSAGFVRGAREDEADAVRRDVGVLTVKTRLPPSVTLAVVAATVMSPCGVEPPAGEAIRTTGTRPMTPATAARALRTDGLGTTQHERYRAALGRMGW